MSIWIRALCTVPVDALTAEDLRAGISERLPFLAAMYGETGDQETIARLSVEVAAPEEIPGAALRPRASVWLLRYGDGAIRVECWSEPAAVKEEVGTLREGLADCDEEEVEEVRALLDHVVQTVRLELKMTDVEGIGWAVAIGAAACFAARGEGLVQADGEGWMAPRGHEVEHVLDGD
jgi:hypothetical protein